MFCCNFFSSAFSSVRQFLNASKADVHSGNICECVWVWPVFSHSCVYECACVCACPWQSQIPWHRTDNCIKPIFLKTMFEGKEICFGNLPWYEPFGVPSTHFCKLLTQAGIVVGPGCDGAASCRLMHEARLPGSFPKLGDLSYVLLWMEAGCSLFGPTFPVHQVSRAEAFRTRQPLDPSEDLRFSP